MLQLVMSYSLNLGECLQNEKACFAMQLSNHRQLRREVLKVFC